MFSNIHTNADNQKKQIPLAAPNEVRENRYYYQPYEDIPESQKLEFPGEASRQQWPMDYSHNFLTTEDQALQGVRSQVGWQKLSHFVYSL